MSTVIEQKIFGITPAAGETVWAYVLRNEYLTAEVLAYGALLRRLLFRGVDIMVLGYENLIDYIHNDGYMGATAERVCNRIGRANFSLGESKYFLAKNDGAKAKATMIYHLAVAPNGPPFDLNAIEDSLFTAAR